MSGKYILNDAGEPVPEPDLLTWGRWMGTAARTIAKSTYGDSNVSTVFLGLDHSFGHGAPVLFETMVFGGALDGEQERYCTRAEAITGHQAMCARVLLAADLPATPQKPTLLEVKARLDLMEGQS